YDVALRDVIDVVLRARPAGLALEASNPRHGHEWSVFADVRLPDDKYLLPGVIDTTTNFVEHPELVAQRIRNYTSLVGESRVVATSDCGFGTFTGRSRVARTVAWAKLRSMVAGAPRGEVIDPAARPPRGRTRPCATFRLRSTIRGLPWHATSK